MSRVRSAGVIGAGVFGGFHAAKYLGAENGNLVAIFDTDFARAKTLADKTGARAVANFDELIRAVDIVSVTCPAAHHFDYAMRALQSGKHVYVEKPITLSIADADALIAEAASRELVLHVGHQERFVMAGLGLGAFPEPPRRLEFHRCGPRSGRCEDVSVVLDFMIHDLDLATVCGAGRPLSANACGGEHEVVATIQYGNGVIASFLASRQSELRKRGMKAFFSDGEIEVDFLTREVRGQLAGNKLDAKAARMAAFWLDDPLGASVQAFIDATHGATEYVIDGRMGRDALKTALLVEEARLALGAHGKTGEYSRI